MGFGASIECLVRGIVGAATNDAIEGHQESKRVGGLQLHITRDVSTSDHIFGYSSDKFRILMQGAR